MNLHPLIANTVALWQFQNNLTDTSGLGDNLTAINAFTNAANPSGELYTTIDACTQGFLYDGSTKLLAPLSTSLQLTGDRTFEVIMKMVSTVEQSIICCADPAGRSGGAGADRIGSVWTYLWDATNEASYFSKTMGSNIPTPHYGNFTGTNNGNWGFNGFHHYAFRNLTVSGTRYASVFIDGVKIAPDVIDLGTTATGVEQVYVGGYEGGGENLVVNSIMASLRVLSYGRSDADIAADAAFTLSACGGGGGGGNASSGGGGGSSGGSQATAASTGLVYDAVAAAQFGIALRQNPRS